MGKEVHIHNRARIFYPWKFSIGANSAIGEDALIYNLGELKIGQFVTISQRSHLCGGTHDYSDPEMRLIRLPITIGNHVWICADAFVGPGVTVGEGAIVAARAVAVKDVLPWTIVAGNPAKQVKERPRLVTH